MAAAQWGQFKTQKDTRQCWGHAMIIDPWGRVLAQCEDGIGFATADLDLAVLDRVRTGLPSHRHHVLDIESVTQASV